MYRKRRERGSRVTEQRQELLEEQQQQQVERQQVRLERLEPRERLSQASKRVLPERSERLELRELQVLPDKQDKLPVERLSLVPRQPELPQLRPVSEALEVSELEQSPAREERQFPEHQPLPPGHSELPVQELLDSLDRRRIPQRLDNSVRTPIRQRPEQLLQQDKLWPVLPGRIPSLLQTEFSQDLEHPLINRDVPEEYRPPAPSHEPPRPHRLASLPSPHLYPSPILIPFQLFLELLIPLLLQIPIRNSNSRLLPALLPLTLSAKLLLLQPVHEPVSRLLASQVPQDSATPSPQPRNVSVPALRPRRSRAASACNRS